MYKEGQKVKFVSFNLKHNITNQNFSIGEVLVISDTGSRQDGDKVVYIKATNFRQGNWYVPVSCIEPIKKKLITENDLLDAIQDNFKEGI